MKNIFVLLFCLLSLTSSALKLSSSAEISIITCDPGKELYALFGHTAVRITDPHHGLDAIFNYGTFDFNTPNFYGKFVQGLLPYQITASSYRSFIRTYTYRNISVYSQTLKLDSIHKQRFMDLIDENLKPENKTYLYSFLYDNCATRVRDLIAKSFSSDDLQWNMVSEEKSFWNLLDEYLYMQPWSKWGIHTVLGQDGTQQASTFETMFLPDYLHKGLTTATYKGKPLNTEIETLFKAKPSEIVNPWYLSPFFVFAVFALLFIAYSYRWPKSLRKTLAFFYFITGILGCLILFLGFFTLHPLTFPNWNILWANPLNILCFIIMFRSKYDVYLKNYLRFNLLLLCITLLLWPMLYPAVSMTSSVIICTLTFLSYRLYKQVRSNTI